MPWMEFAFIGLLTMSGWFALASILGGTSLGQGARYFAVVATIGIAATLLMGPWAAVVLPPVLIMAALATILASKRGRMA